MPKSRTVAKAAKAAPRGKTVKVVRAKKRGNALAREASPEKCFWVNNGPVCKNAVELCAALETMSDAQFKYHAKSSRNDFACWLEEVLGHSACAASVRKARTRASAAKALKTCRD